MLDVQMEGGKEAYSEDKANSIRMRGLQASFMPLVL